MRWSSKPNFRSQDGGVTILAAVSLTTLIVSTALAVDVGNVFLAKRHLQGAADAAAMAAVMMPNGRDQAVTTALSDNGVANRTSFSVIAGNYIPDGKLDASARFVAGSAVGNAARVQVKQDVPLFFASIMTGSDTMSIVAEATAAKMDYAAFSISSRLASVQGGLPNAILSGLVGSDLKLTVMDYNALVETDVNLLTFVKALNSQIGLSAATFGETLNTEVSLPDALAALAAASTGQSGVTSISKLQASVPSTKIRLADLIDLGPFANTDRGDASAVTTDAYALIQQMLVLANGQRQVALDLVASIPGITSTAMTLAIGQRPTHSPWLAIAKDGSVIVRTSQARLYLDSQIGGAAKLGLISLRVPIYVELAEASAKLRMISCASGRSKATVSLDVLPSVGHAAIADIGTSTLGNFTIPVTQKPAVLARLPAVTVTGQSSVKFGGVTWQPLSFSMPEITSGVTKTVSTNDIVEGVVVSLIKTMDLKSTLIGIGIEVPGATALVGTALTPLAPSLDKILNDVTGLLGAHVGQADVRVDGVRCGKATLVG